MRGNTARPDPILRHGGRTVWVSLGWKVLLVAALFLLLSFDNPVLTALSWSIVNLLPVLLLAWGGLVVAVATANLSVVAWPLRWAWVALAVGAFAALTIPGIFAGPGRFEDALGPVTALTLAAQLGRRDLPGALRDWATLMGVSLIAALGVLSMWSIAAAFSFSIWVFVAAVLLPPLVFEGLMLLLGRFGSLRSSRAGQIVVLVLATALAVWVLSASLLADNTSIFWSLVFDLVAGLLIGGALLVAWITRPMIEVASGARHGVSSHNLGRILVELSQAPILISLAIYLPLRLLNRA